MNKIRQFSLVLGMLIVSGSVFAAQSTSFDTVRKIVTWTHGFTHVYLDIEAIPDEACGNVSRAMIDPKAVGAPAMLAGLLYAKLEGMTVALKVDGCLDSGNGKHYPNVVKVTVQ